MALTLLALDTSTDACSAALWHQNHLIERYQIAPRQHTALLLPMVEELLQAADLTLSQLDAIAFGCGPGSFTGLRVVASMVQAIAFAHDLPVLPISTLQALAQGAYRELQAEYVVAALDAAMQEIYAGFYHLKNGIMSPAAAEQVCKPEALSTPNYGCWTGVGNGWDLYHEPLTQRLAAQLQQWFPQRYPRAYDIAVLAAKDYHSNKLLSAEQALPVYLRDDVFKKG